MIGPTEVVHILQYVGYPFNSDQTRRVVLRNCFGEGSFDERRSSSESTLWLPDRHEDDRGQLTRVELANDSVKMTWQIRRMGVEEWETAISGRPTSEVTLLKALFSAFGLEKEPEIHEEKWDVQAVSVDCIEWLKKNRVLSEKILGVGEASEVRPVMYVFAIHNRHPETISQSADIRRRTERASLLTVQVVNSGDWDNRRGKVVCSISGGDLVSLKQFLKTILVQPQT